MEWHLLSTMAVQTGRLPMRCRGCRVGAYACFLLKVTSLLCRMTQHMRIYRFHLLLLYLGLKLLISNFHSLKDSGLGCFVYCYMHVLCISIESMLVLCIVCRCLQMLCNMQYKFVMLQAWKVHVCFHLVLCSSSDVCCKIVLEEFCVYTHLQPFNFTTVIDN